MSKHYRTPEDALIRAVATDIDTTDSRDRKGKLSGTHVSGRVTKRVTTTACRQQNCRYRGAPRSREAPKAYADLAEGSAGPRSVALLNLRGLAGLNSE